MYPLKFKNIVKELIWGGQNLKQVLQLEIPEDKKIGEIWKIADYKDDISIIENGKYKGISLKEILNKYPKEVLGKNHELYIDKFPLLIKFIDANDDLSIQVHPDQINACKYEEAQPKTEMWYILDAKEESSIIYGFKKDISYENLKQIVEKNEIESILNKIKVKKGDTILVNAGTVHAIGKGIVLLEIQQNSDTTYRLYDYNRIGIDGKPRPLHIEKAIECIDLKNGYNYNIQNFISNTKNLETEYFKVEILELNSDEYINIDNNDNLSIIIGTSVNGKIYYKNNNEEKTEIINIGDVILMPASIEKYKITGNGTIVKITI